MKAMWANFIGKFKASDSLPRERLTSPETQIPIYAIGDVHGCHELQKVMEQKILDDDDFDKNNKLIVYLGDLVDRGPSSAEVIEHCLSDLPNGCRRICLCGNHDQAFYNFLKKPNLKSEWLDYGGQETLQSYGIDVGYLKTIKTRSEEFEELIRQSIPESHVKFLKSMPIMLSTPKVHFVHAGLRPGFETNDQTDYDLMWIREDFLIDEPASDRFVVHGHTPALEPNLGPMRIGVDTSAYSGGPLTALRIFGDDYAFFSVDNNLNFQKKDCY